MGGVQAHTRRTRKRMRSRRCPGVTPGARAVPDAAIWADPTTQFTTIRAIEGFTILP